MERWIRVGKINIAEIFIGAVLSIVQTGFLAFWIYYLLDKREEPLGGRGNQVV
jgi:hypothetical protein